MEYVVRGPEALYSKLTFEALSEVCWNLAAEGRVVRYRIAPRGIVSIGHADDICSHAYFHIHPEYRLELRSNSWRGSFTSA